MQLHHDLSSVLRASTFEIVPGVYVYARVQERPRLGEHFLITQDRDEITVVTREENLDHLHILERHPDPLALVALNVSVPFYAVGFLASVGAALAKRGLNILMVSAYSRDYVLFRRDRLGDAEAALRELGMHLVA